MMKAQGKYMFLLKRRQFTQGTDEDAGSASCGIAMCQV